ncbi:MAG: AAA family ATPase [Candidatus Phytoplasma stylosanthis]|nr:AAA family ATPase [Candidatus Phytoplasma stylosanthis]
MQNKKQFIIVVILTAFTSLLIFLFLIERISEKLETLYSNANSEIDNPKNYDDYYGINPEKNSSNNSIKDLFTPSEINYEGFKTYDDIYGLEEQVKNIKKIMDRFINQDKYYFKKGKNDKDRYIASNPSETDTTELPKGVVFFGPPGTGKTLLAKSVAKETKMNFYTITPKHSIQEIEDVFKKARNNSPSIIFADEAEEIVKSRDGTIALEEGDAKKTDLILAELDGVKTDKDRPIYFIAATNHIEKIDSAIKSRLEKIFIGYFNKEKRLGYLQLIASQYNIHPESFSHLEKIAERFNEALKEPEKYAVQITLNEWYIPAIGENEDKENLKTLDELLSEQEFQEKCKKVFSNDKKYTKEYVKQKYNKIDDDTKYFMFLKNLEKVKKHFYDIKSGRKLEMLITNAVNNAGYYKHDCIKITDLDEAFETYLGFPTK